MVAAAGTMVLGSRNVEIIQLFWMVAVPELSWLRLPVALAKVVSIYFEMAEATGVNGTGTSKSGFHIILNAFTHGTGKCLWYLTASTRLKRERKLETTSREKT